MQIIHGSKNNKIIQWLIIQQEESMIEDWNVRYKTIYRSIQREVIAYKIYIQISYTGFESI